MGRTTDPGVTSQYAEDTAHAAADPLTVVGTKRTDTAAASAGTDGDYQTLNTDATGLLWVREYYEIPGASSAIDMMKVEHQYSNSGVLVADTQVKASAGFVHTVTIANTDIAATAGTIDIYDSLSATGTKIFSAYIPVSNTWAPFTVTLDVICATGIYVDFTTTADVNVFVSYR